MPGIFKNFLCHSLLLSFILVSCSVQKRVHRKGYHVVWDHHKKNVSEQAIAMAVVDPPAPEAPLETSSNVETILLPRQKAAAQLEQDTCTDILKLRNGDELKIQLVEIGEEYIKYKRCDKPNGPTLAIRKKSVSKIIYKNDGEENVVVLNEEGYQIGNNDGAYAPTVPKKENQLGNLSAILEAILYVVSMGLLFFSVFLSAGWLLYAYLVVFGISLILPTTVAYMALFQFKNEPGKYYGKWIPVYIIADRLFALAVAVTIFLLVKVPLQQFFPLILLFAVLAGLFIYALVPKRKNTSAK